MLLNLYEKTPPVWDSMGRIRLPGITDTHALDLENLGLLDKLNPFSSEKWSDKAPDQKEHAT